MKIQISNQNQVSLCEIISKIQDFTEWIYQIRIHSNSNITNNIDSFIAYLQSKNVSVLKENVVFENDTTVNITFKLSILSPREVEIEEILEQINKLFK